MALRAAPSSATAPGRLLGPPPWAMMAAPTTTQLPRRRVAWRSSSPRPCDALLPGRKPAPCVPQQLACLQAMAQLQLATEKLALLQPQPPASPLPLLKPCAQQQRPGQRYQQLQYGWMTGSLPWQQGPACSPALALLTEAGRRLANTAAAAAAPTAVRAGQLLALLHMRCRCPIKQASTAAGVAAHALPVPNKTREYTTMPLGAHGSKWGMPPVPAGPPASAASVAAVQVFSDVSTRAALPPQHWQCRQHQGQEQEGDAEQPDWRPPEPPVAAVAGFGGGAGLNTAAALHPARVSVAASDPASEVPFAAACVASQQPEHRPWAAVRRVMDTVREGASQGGSGIADSRGSDALPWDRPSAAPASSAGRRAGRPPRPPLAPGVAAAAAAAARAQARLPTRDPPPPYEARAWRAAPFEDFSPLFSSAASQAQQARQHSRQAGAARGAAPGPAAAGQGASTAAAAAEQQAEGASPGWAERRARVLAWLGRRG
ncbi:hypothetical protein ABPG75_007076 [Micractinium tetrahymenae]